VTEAADAVFCVLDDPDQGGKARASYGIPEDTMNAHKNILGLLKAMPSIIAAEAKTHLAISEMRRERASGTMSMC